MNIFDKRPLGMILCIVLGGFVIFSFSGPVFKYISAAGALLFLFCIILFFKKKRRTFLLIGASLLLISMLLSFIYFDLWFPSYKRFEGEVTLYATVTDKDSSDRTDIYTVRADNIDAAAFSGYKIVIMTERGEYPLSEGNKISFKTTLADLSNETKTYYRKAGISASAEYIKELSLISEGYPPLSSLLGYAREYLTRRLIMASDMETGSLIAALIMGERDMLSPSLRLDFSRIGISHILSLSGMHLAVLALGIDLLLSKLRVKRTLRVAFTILFSLCYMVFTGFSLTIVRAGIMMIISSLCFLFRKTHDSFTSLCISVFLIVLFSPYAIYDISLWLSAFATAGVIASAECIEKLRFGEDRLGRFTKRMAYLILPSVFAIGFTLAISVTAFEELSVLSPAMTLIFSPIIEMIMYLGSLLLIFGRLLPIGHLLIPLCKMTSSLSGALSSFEYAAVSARDGFIFILSLLISLSFILFSVMKIKRKREAVAVLCSCFVLFFSLSLISAVCIDRKDNAFYTPLTSESIIIKDSGEAVFIPLHSPSKSNSYNDLELLRENKITYLDKYMAVSYSRALCDELEIILSRTKTRAVLIPSPRNDEERAICSDISRLLEGFCTELVIFDIGEECMTGEIKTSLIFSSRYGEDAAMAALLIEGRENRSVYLSSGIVNSDIYTHTVPFMEISDTVIFGAGGKRYSKITFLDNYLENAKRIYIFSKDLHLTPMEEQQYKKGGCEIYLDPSQVKLY